MTAAADAAHCQGFGTQSYGMAFDVIVYDTNNHIIAIYFSHYVAAEGSEMWNKVIQSVAEIDGFNVENRVTVVYQEKIIDTSYKLLQKIHMFLDTFHAKQSMRSAIGTEIITGLNFYELAVLVPPRFILDYLKEQFGPNQETYLSKFKDDELYVSFRTYGCKTMRTSLFHNIHCLISDLFIMI